MGKRKKNRNFVSQNNLLGEKKISDNEKELSEKYVHSIEIREKRIGIVFKVIYVLAVFLATLIMMVPSNAGEKLFTEYMIETCFTAYLTCLLFKMIIYIFNELKCFKLDNNELPQQQVIKTEKSYAKIFDYFSEGGIITIILIIIIPYINIYLTRDKLSLVIVGGAACGAVISNVQFKKHERFLQFISDTTLTVVMISIIIIAKLGEGA